MSAPAAPGFIRYLAAKKGLDDRSLNRQVWDTLAQALGDRPDSAPLRVLEVGCGIGTMVERLLDRGLLTRAAYTGIDVDPGCIRAAAQRLQDYAAARQVPLTVDAGGAMLFAAPAQDVRITFAAADLFDFLDREPEKAAWDLLVAHAVLDLIDLPTALPRLLSRLAPGGLFYFTLNFDGATISIPLSTRTWTPGSKPCITAPWTTAATGASPRAAAAPAANSSGACKRRAPG
jgi:trans-aconitate methyltransferase